jgi:hypothetical protein
MWREEHVWNFSVLRRVYLSNLKKPSSLGLEPMAVSRDCGLCSCNLPTKTNNFGLGAVLLSCLVFELQKSSSPGLEPRTDIRSCGLCSCNLFAEANNFGWGAVVLSCLVSELQKPPSPRLEPRTLLRSFNLSKISSWLHCIRRPSLGQIGETFSKYKQT